ncbi:zinc-binding alcohol dehydrogenase family protein [Limosilactobacillus agrestimuris]|uniref:zinc-binding alcohol dehydrogenase family protein n=1 Tax=Limosilactobacillus agrestimuris TaxID=2941331 RepID=UPI00203BF5DC|nr:zinc-binding alcohol dehydrogenase family protein [Limosilactobacillus agrestimuris]
MKAVVIKKGGGPEQLVYQDVPTPKVKPGWSLVKVKGFGINHSEIFTRKGLSPTVKFPRILGIECVGEIIQTTDPVKLPVGQKIISIMGEMGRAFDGSYAEYVLLPNSQIYPVTTNLPWKTLATVPETYYTAYGSLLNLKLTKDDSVLVRGASSGVGVAFLKLAKACYPGIQVDGTTRTKDKVERMKELGFDEVILDQDGKLQTDKRYSKILELIGPATIKETFSHLEKGGIVCSTGQLGNQWYLEEFDPIFDLAPNSYLTSFYSGSVSGKKLNQLLQVIEGHHINVEPTKVYRLEQIPQAHQYLESHRSLGKVIVLND